MKTKTLKRDKVNIITLGCSKNMVDSEVLSGQLLANEIDVVHAEAYAKILAVNFTRYRDTDAGISPRVLGLTTVLNIQNYWFAGSTH